MVILGIILNYKPELAPENPENDSCWNMNGWIANEVWPNGMDSYKFNEALSLGIDDKDQREVDQNWEALPSNGGA